ncbi:cardiolipin synthase [Hydrogenophaga palleronii]|uniref:Cardiolipin synthase B n=1 Tax=Hydrogenophaga palleronii TaxID=65655 RepID=A0ABU1WN65_9BURK|nr:cardiolipin synthase ClsB [Hydrogenophaga palleronii]MDR7150644.1 cardiolipin synthase [Hydrogenophaga palleronii]
MNSLWVPGNRFALLENGEEFFPRVFSAIEGAEREVLIETFIWFDDQVGQALRDVLIAAARRGVETHVLIDGWGSPDIALPFAQSLLDAGVRLRSFEPARRLFGARINMLGRMHHKLVVIDARRAFVGGINYAKDHLVELDAMSKQDYAVEIEGPLVEQIHAFCRANLEKPQPERRLWMRRWGARMDRRGSTPGTASGGAVAAFVTRDNSSQRTDIERQYRVAIRSAQRRIVIANAYFFPGYRLLRDLRRAARRGVQVDLILQGQPDMPWVQRATMLLYELLLRAGVHIHEFVERPLHAKVAVIDDEWATVGSSNLDPTSLSLNLEANVMMRDQGFATELRQALDALIENKCVTVNLPRPGPLRSIWLAVRTTIVYHVLRRFPAWVRWTQSRAPRVVPLQAETP